MTDILKPLEGQEEERLRKVLNHIEEELKEDEAEEVLEALEDISESKEPVSFRLKDPPLSFQSRFVVKNNHVLVLKPQKIAPFVHENSIITLNYTDVDEKARHEYLIALKVIRPEVRINDKLSAVVCQIPKEFLLARDRKRLLQRYDVSSFEWQLGFPKRRAIFKVIDITRTGLAFRAHPRYHPWFPIDRIFHDLILNWEGRGEVKILFFRIRQVEGVKISGRMGLSNKGMERLNEWLQLL